VPCAAGLFKPASGNVACTLCGNNTFSTELAATNASTCQACPANTAQLGQARNSVSTCVCRAGYEANTKNPTERKYALSLLDKFEYRISDIVAVLCSASEDERWQMRETSIARLQYTLNNSKLHCHVVMFTELVTQMILQIKFTTDSSMLFRTFYAEYNLYHAVRKYWSIYKKAHEDIIFRDIRSVFLRTKEMYAPMLELMAKCKAQQHCRMYSEHMQTIFDDMHAKLKLFTTGNPLPEFVACLRLPPT